MNLKNRFSNDSITVKTVTDDFGRTEDVETTYAGDTTYSPFHTEYGYVTNGNKTTNLVGTLTQSYGTILSSKYEYKYDSNNITDVYFNKAHIAHYIYDELNQLKTASDSQTDRITEYSYDNAGNITQTKEYRLVAIDTIDKNNVKGSLLKTNTYTYGDTNWKDKLTSYNGQTITYDAIGNPLKYRDGMTMSWMVGRELSQVTKSNKTYSFKYNADGLRTEKKCETDGNTAHYYYDSNGNMIAFRRNNAAVVYFYYDSEGNVTSMSFEGTKYFFIKNIQGDVEKIVTHQGNVAVTYKYDAWGKLISKTDNTVYGIGELNPFRYRGYIYDDETGLYYLKSRYYDPVTGRFLNADDTAYIGATDSPLGINAFSYCENNPVNYIDISGNAGVLIFVLGIVVGLLVTWIVDGIIHYCTGKSGAEWVSAFIKFIMPYVKKYGKALIKIKTNYIIRHHLLPYKPRRLLKKYKKKIFAKI